MVFSNKTTNYLNQANVISPFLITVFKVKNILLSEKWSYFILKNLRFHYVDILEKFFLKIRR